jgi:hypothetical protein
VVSAPRNAALSASISGTSAMGPIYSNYRNAIGCYVPEILRVSSGCRITDMCENTRNW